MSTLALWITLIPVLSAAALAAVSLSGKGRAAAWAIAVIPNALALVLSVVVLVLRFAPQKAHPEAGNPVASLTDW